MSKVQDAYKMNILVQVLLIRKLLDFLALIFVNMGVALFDMLKGQKAYPYT